MSMSLGATLIAAATISQFFIATTSAATSTSSNTLTLVDLYSGSTFFDSWDFYTTNANYYNAEPHDPSNGYVHYVSQSQAEDDGLIQYYAPPATTASNYGLATVSSSSTFTNTSGYTYIGADHKSNGGNAGRKSVRISTKRTYTYGLFLFDLNHSPIGCGSWPAIWTLAKHTSDGKSWPEGGEIDIVEAVNSGTTNAATLHTEKGCTMDSTQQNQTGTLTHSDCAYDSSTGDNTGCGVNIPPSGASIGAPFNAAGGGVYAMLWEPNAIRIWFFQRSSIPSDVVAALKDTNTPSSTSSTSRSTSLPSPLTWPTPSAHFPLGSNCPSSYFSNHSIVINIDFCGDWAGSVFSQSCSGNCIAFVRDNYTAFNDTYFSINSIKVYSVSGDATLLTTSSSVSRMHYLHSSSTILYLCIILVSAMILKWNV